MEGTIWCICCDVKLLKFVLGTLKNHLKWKQQSSRQKTVQTPSATRPSLLLPPTPQGGAGGSLKLVLFKNSQKRAVNNRIGPEVMSFLVSARTNDLRENNPPHKTPKLQLLCDSGVFFHNSIEKCFIFFAHIYLLLVLYFKVVTSYLRCNYLQCRQALYEYNTDVKDE